MPVRDNRGFFKLPDRLFFKEGKELIFKERKGEEIKILGERVNLSKLSQLLEKLSQNLKGEFYLLAVPDERKGKKLALMTTHFDFSQIIPLITAFNSKALAFEKIQAFYSLSDIKKSTLSKFRQKKALQQLAFKDL